jgi:hypothetical protein
MCTSQKSIIKHTNDMIYLVALEELSSKGILLPPLLRSVTVVSFKPPVGVRNLDDDVYLDGLQEKRCKYPLYGWPKRY